MATAWTLPGGLAVWVVVRHQIQDVLDHALKESGELLYGMVSLPATGALLAQQPGGALAAPRHQEDLIWRVVGTDGRLLLRSHGAPSIRLLPQARAGL